MSKFFDNTRMDDLDEAIQTIENDLNVMLGNLNSDIAKLTERLDALEAAMPGKQAEYDLTGYEEFPKEKAE